MAASLAAAEPLAGSDDLSYAPAHAAADVAALRQSFAAPVGVHGPEHVAVAAPKLSPVAAHGHAESGADFYGGAVAPTHESADPGKCDI